VIHHGMDATAFPVGAGEGGHLACLGRMAPEKGIHTAIEVAREADLPLLIGAKMREAAERDYFEAEVRPLLGGSIEYLGELGTTDKLELLGGAVALVNPIRWAEPFGLVMTESMACGTPVVSTPCGAVPEIVTHGVTGFICDTTAEMVDAVQSASTLSRDACRHEVETTFSMQRMVEDHITFYQKVIDDHKKVVHLGRDLVMEA